MYVCLRLLVVRHLAITECPSVAKQHTAVYQEFQMHYCLLHGVLFKTITYACECFSALLTGLTTMPGYHRENWLSELCSSGLLSGLPINMQITGHLNDPEWIIRPFQRTRRPFVKCCFPKRQMRATRRYSQDQKSLQSQKTKKKLDCKAMSQCSSLAACVVSCHQQSTRHRQPKNLGIMELELQTLLNMNGTMLQNMLVRVIAACHGLLSPYSCPDSQVATPPSVAVASVQGPFRSHAVSASPLRPKAKFTSCLSVFVMVSPHALKTMPLIAVN